MTNEATTDKTHDPLCIGGNKGPCNCGATTDEQRALDALGDLIKCAAILATGSYTISDDQSDWGVKVPASVMHQITKQNERLGSLAIRMKRSTDTIRAALTRDNSNVYMLIIMGNEGDDNAT